jgi:hypothetical protein
MDLLILSAKLLFVQDGFDGMRRGGDRCAPVSSVLAVRSCKPLPTWQNACFFSTYSPSNTCTYFLC